MSLSAIILAAGKSTRMKSDLPKPLHLICGRPMLSYILQAAFEAGADKAFVVVGHGKEQVIDAFASDGRIEFVEQTEQLGTGHAAKVCLPNVRKLGVEGQDVILLAGDVPLIRGQVLRKLVEDHRKAEADASMATAELPDPFGYGRVIRDSRGEFLRIVEQVDTSPAEAAVQEVFPSLYCVRGETLVDVLARLKNDNAKGEYYLTDLFHLTREGGGKVLAIKAVGPDDILAPNTRAQLAEADALLQKRIHAELFEAGVSIVSPATTYIEADVRIGRETRLGPFTFIARGARIGERCEIGPFAHVAADAVVRDDTNLRGNIEAAGPIGSVTGRQ
jgi:bifunctional UDP-N-acetylglucosamine pyrophosphorylase/glucosamine-1-phosphate N-acetyltransferase